MADGIETSFRIKEAGLRTLDSLRDYFSDVNRSDICAAAICMFAKSDARNESPAQEEPRPFDFCAEPVRSVFNKSYRAGKTTNDIKIVFGENTIELSRSTRFKCAGLSGAAFQLTNKSAVMLDLACDYHAEWTETGGRRQLIIKLTKEELTMQNRESGREANRIGRYIAGEIADILGTALISENSNECTYEGQRCVIKAARRGNGLFGITKKMHERLDYVILAAETEASCFDVYLIAMDALIASCPTTGEYSGRGRVTSYTVTAAMSLGKKIETVEIDLSDFDPAYRS